MRILCFSPLGVLAAFAVALAARLLYFSEVHASPEFNSLVLDAQWYHTEALRIGAEGWMPREALFRAPGYPYFLACLYRCWDNGLLAARIAQVLLASASAGLVFWIGSRTFGVWVGWISGILAATYGAFIYFSLEILGTSLVAASALLALALLLWAEGSGRRWAWFIAGVGLGLSAVTRPTILVFGILAMIWAGARPARRAGLTNALLVALGLVVCVAPVTLVNYAAGGEWVFIAHQGGVNYYIGNNAQADGKTAAGPGVGDAALMRSVGKTQDTVYLGAKIRAERAVGRELKPSEVSRYWLGQSIRYIRNQPGHWFGLQLGKLYYFWNGYEIDNNRDIGAFVRANSPSLSLPHPGFWLVGPLGLVGLVLGFRRSRESGLIILFVAGQMIAVVAFFVCERFRVPAVLVLTMPAALTVVRAAEWCRNRDWTRVAVLAVVLALLFWGVNTRGLGVAKDRDVAVHLFNQATAYMEQGLYDDAIDTYRKVLELDSWDAKTHFSLGSAYLAKGFYDRAVSAYDRAIALDPALEAAVHNDTGIYFILEKQLSKAEEQFLAALRVDPGYALAGLNLAHVYRATGRGPLAVEQYRRILELPDVSPEQRSVALAEVALSTLEEGKPEEAMDLIRRALKYNRANETARLYLGDIMVGRGERENAIREWRALAEEAENETVQAEAARRLKAAGG